jgi:hypothetical protein
MIFDEVIGLSMSGSLGSRQSGGQAENGITRALLARRNGRRER